jgi:hypothetical protein
LAGLVACVVVAGAAGLAQAELVSYTIVPAQSSLSVSGNLTGNFASPQTAGSTTTSFSGNIAANLTANTIEFPGGSMLNAALLAANQQPRADATPGSAPANYGRTAPGPFSSTTLEAIRGLELFIEDDTSGAGIPFAGQNFSSADLVLVINSGESDSLFGNTSNEIDLSGKGTANSNGNGQSSLTQSGGIETLTLKFSTGSIGYSINQSVDTSLIFTGTIVATREVPEPASASMAAVAVAGSMLLPRRRARRV